MKNSGNTEIVTASDLSAAAVTRGSNVAEGIVMEGHYSVKCFGPREELRDEYNEKMAEAARLISSGKIEEGNTLANSLAWMLEEKWEDTIKNLVTTVGKNFVLDTTMSGSGYTATWYIGLVNGPTAPTYSAADTMASHAGWTENTNYSQASRPTAAWSAASAGVKALSAALTFSINVASQNIIGCFLTTVATKGGTTGTLYSVGSFTEGNKAVGVGDTLAVSYSTTAS